MSLDLLLFSSFLALSLILGIISSTKVHNISEYAIGNRDFSTATIVATLVATWVGAGLFSYTLIETYRQGIYFLIPLAIDSLVLIFIGHFLAPRMGEFLGKLSIAESMGQIFGPRVKAVTVMLSFVRSICYLGVNFQVSAKILELVFGTSGQDATILSGLIVIIYSTLGGIRAVTFTDIIQFFTFGCLIPTIVIIVWQALGDGNTTIVLHTLSTSPLFNYKDAFDLQSIKFYHMLGMGLFFMIPELEPPIFQRICMARSVNQVITAFKIAGILCFLFQFIVAMLAIFILSDNPNLNPDNLVSYIINHYTYTGFKGLVAVGIMAMIMSSADSMINSVSIIFAHDVCKPLGFKWAKNELLVARFTAVIVGFTSMFFALRIDSVFELILSFAGLYLPMVSIPFIFAIFGFRSSEKSVLFAMTGSLMTIFLWKVVFSESAIDSFIPGILTSIFFLFGTHYLLCQPGGWVGIKDEAPLIAIRQERRFKVEQFLHSIMNFDFVKFLEKNSPNSESMYVYTGFFCFLSFYLNLITVPYNHTFAKLFEFVTPLVLCMATSLFIYPLWSDYLKSKETIVRLIWNIVSFYSLIFVGFMFAIAANFASPQVMILMVNLIVIALLVRWQWALIMILSGIFVVWRFTNFHFAELIVSNQASIKLQIIYLLLLMSSLLLIFLKPKQEGQTLAMERIKHLKSKILSYEVSMLQAMSSNFKVHDINKYYEKPGNNMAIAHMFFDFYDNLSHTEQKETARLVLKSVMRLENFESNIANLNALARDDVNLKREEIDFAHLIKERLSICRKLYEEEGNEKQFILNISENVKIIGDRFYFEQMVDNLIINAITYCTSNSIALHLEKIDPGSMRLYLRI